MEHLDQNIQSFIESNINNDFGLTVEQVAEQCKQYGRFSSWLNSDVPSIINLLNTVKQQGVSPAFFASYEKTEGYNSSWGWLNHTTVNGTPTQDAISVSQWIVSQSQNMNDNPAWIDVGNPVDFVPQSVKDSGNQHFQGLPSGTIGRVVISGTAAATWEVYYPQGLLEEYNQVQDYGAPLTAMVDTIIAWGGTIEGSDSGSKPQFPTLDGLPITSGYGYRGDIGVPGASEYHWAIDIGSGGQTDPPIYATQDGVVTNSRWFTGGGWGVTIRHTSDPYHSRYLHMKSQSPLTVGQRVVKGQTIGIMGTTGISSGVHLDFAISINGTFGTEQDTIDPEIYLDMEFSGGETPPNSVTDDLITLLLVDALAGWKW